MWNKVKSSEFILLSESQSQIDTWQQYRCNCLRTGANNVQVNFVQAFGVATSIRVKRLLLERIG